MSLEAIFNPNLYMNGNPIQIAPNSYKVTTGYGEYKYRTQSNGDNVTGVASKDLETAYAKITFDLIVENQDTEDEVYTWKRNFNRNVLHDVRSDGSKTKVYKNLIVTNDPQFEYGRDSTVTIEAAANKAI